MFTGIVQHLGRILSSRARGRGLSLEVLCETLKGVEIGESVAVNGVCLTVERFHGVRATFALSPETLSRSHPSKWETRRLVNLEQALALSDRLGGHIVQGHIDGLATVVDLSGGDFPVLSVEIPPDLSRYVVPKGSIALDGVSLTVASLDGFRLSVAAIPHTLERTTLSTLKAGDPVHVEVDVLAKYVERLISHESL